MRYTFLWVAWLDTLVHSHGDERRQLSVHGLISITSKLDTIILAFLCRVFLFIFLCFVAIVCVCIYKTNMCECRQFHLAREKWNRREGFHIDFGSFWMANEAQFKEYRHTHIPSKDNNEWSGSPWNGWNWVRCRNASDSRMVFVPAPASDCQIKLFPCNAMRYI